MTVVDVVEVSSSALVWVFEDGAMVARAGSEASPIVARVDLFGWSVWCPERTVSGGRGGFDGVAHAECVVAEMGA